MTSNCLPEKQDTWITAVMSETQCENCGYDFELDYERFYDKFSKDKNHKEGFTSNNITMREIRNCTDENGEAERYEIEMTCPKCKTVNEHTDWSK